MGLRQMFFLYFKTPFVSLYSPNTRTKIVVVDSKTENMINPTEFRQSTRNCSRLFDRVFGRRVVIFQNEKKNNNKTDLTKNRSQRRRRHRRKMCVCVCVCRHTHVVVS